MITTSQSQYDRILWILANSGGKMERSRLRRYMGKRDADLDHILEELENEGKIIWRHHHQWAKRL